jgi:hypothetical protein
MGSQSCYTHFFFLVLFERVGEGINVLQPRQRWVICPCRNGAIKTLKIQEKVTAKRVVYYYNRCQVEVHCCMYLVQTLWNVHKIFVYYVWLVKEKTGLLGKVKWDNVEMMG